MLQGFKDFISRGNAIDLAVGVIIGGAFSTVVSALTDKFLMPLISAIFGKPNFDKVGAFTLNGSEVMPGAIVTALVNFLLVAAALYFFLVVPMNKLHELGSKDMEEGPADEEDSDETKLLKQIRDLMRQQQGLPPVEEPEPAEVSADAPTDPDALDKAADAAKEAAGKAADAAKNLLGKIGNKGGE